MLISATEYIVCSDSTILDVIRHQEVRSKDISFVCLPNKQFKGVVTSESLRKTLSLGMGLSSKVCDAIDEDYPVVYASDDASKIELTYREYSIIPVIDESRFLEGCVDNEVERFLPIANPSIGAFEIQNVIDAVASGWVSSRGQYVDQFERNFAEFCGTNYAVSCTNGTIALHLALTALGITDQHEVIVPAMTFPATPNAVMYCGAKPVFVDVLDESWGINPQKIANAVTSRTRAIIPVHLFGIPAVMDEICEIAKIHGLSVVEDAAQAHGAKYAGQRVGNLGDMGCFSFFGNKILTTGEGGMVTVNDDDLYQKLLLLRDHGMSKDRRYWHEVLGFNYRMTNLSAALGVAQVTRWKELMDKRIEISDYFDQEICENLRRPAPTPLADPVSWLYTLALPVGRSEKDRDTLLAELATRSIESRPVFYPLPAMPPYKTNENWKEQYPVASDIGYSGFSIPSHPGLTKPELQRISDAVNEISAKLL